MNNTILIDLPSLGLIKITGLDAAKFLQGQLTCDVREVTEQQSRLGAHCDSKGRIQATFRLFYYQGDYYLQLPRTQIQPLLNVLKKYALFSKVTLTDISNEWQQLGITGDNCATALASLTEDPLPEKTDITLTSNNLIITRLPHHTTTPRFCLLILTTDSHEGWRVGGFPATRSLRAWQGAAATGPRDHRSTNVVDKDKDKDFNNWQKLDIEAGIATLFPETANQFTPQQINYTALNAVSFTKGCYIGQEIIARTHYLGKAKQHLYKINFQNPNALEFQPGTKLISMNNGDLQECGTLIQATQQIGLAVIHDNALTHTIYIENLKQPILHIQELTYTNE